MSSSQSNPWRVRGGTPVLIGAPAVPLRSVDLDVLRTCICRHREIEFAYTPQLYIKDAIDPPRQILYLVMSESTRGSVNKVMELLSADVQSRWSVGKFIDMLPVFSDDPWLGDVIRTGCFLAANDEEAHRRCKAAAGVTT